MARILLVEDDPDVLLFFKEILLEAGYRVDTARTVSAASHLLASRRYTLLLTDGRLPDGIGITLADQAKTKSLPTLIVTGFLNGLRQLNPKINFKDYNVLEKPVVPHVLLAKVADILGSDQRQSANSREAAEALFRPNQSVKLPQAGTPVPNRMRRKPRILAASPNIAALKPAPVDAVARKTAPVISDQEIPKVRAWIKYGMTAAQVAHVCGVSVSEVKRVLAQH